MQGQIQGLLVFTPLGELAVIFTWLSCLTPKFGAHNRKMSLQKFPRMTKKRIKCVHLAILFQIYTGVLST